MAENTLPYMLFDFEHLKGNSIENTDANETDFFYRVVYLLMEN